jgi:hypothetical protein
MESLGPLRTPCLRRRLGAASRDSSSKCGSPCAGEVHHFRVRRRPARTSDCPRGFVDNNGSLLVLTQLPRSFLGVVFSLQKGTKIMSMANITEAWYNSTHSRSLGGRRRSMALCRNPGTKKLATWARNSRATANFHSARVSPPGHETRQTRAAMWIPVVFFTLETEAGGIRGC